MKDNGAKAANEWVTADGVSYWIDSNTYMAKGWRQVNGKWYFLRSNGAMARNPVSYTHLFCLYPAVVEGEQENKKYLIFLLTLYERCVNFKPVSYTHLTNPACMV